MALKSVNNSHCMKNLDSAETRGGGAVSHSNLWHLEPGFKLIWKLLSCKPGLSQPDVQSEGLNDSAI